MLNDDVPELGSAYLPILKTPAKKQETDAALWKEEEAELTPFELLAPQQDTKKPVTP